MAQPLTADEFIATVRGFQSEAERAKIARYFHDPDSEIIGVRMKHTFDTAKAFAAMPLGEVNKLLESPFYEARVGAVSIMDFQTRRPGMTDDERRVLYELYLRRHDRINNWDLVDRAAPRVIGWYLLDKPRDVLFELARSANVWERRTAVTATFWFSRQGDIDDSLRISEVLLHDPEDLINKPVGTGLREVGRIDEARLVNFLETHGGIPRATLRIAVENLPSATRARLLAS